MKLALSPNHAVRILGILVCCMVCVVSLWTGLKGIYVGITAESWPATQGIIISSEVVKCGRGGLKKCPAVTYQYHVDGNRYVGNRITLGFHDAGNAFETVAILKPSEEVTVRYSPSRPETSALHLKGQHWIDWFFLVGGIFSLYALINQRSFMSPILTYASPSEQNRRRCADLTMEREIHERQDEQNRSPEHRL